MAAKHGPVAEERRKRRVYQGTPVSSSSTHHHLVALSHGPSLSQLAVGASREPYPDECNR
ncbi:hypothetical protein C2E23DRAFT_831044 [Lenzites betulinus]|nr:hypothetical protein C2E23DRAFT_831044 [Lenzites betulinus]